MDNLIQLQNGSKGFGSKLLFEDASFAINEGEHVGVIGPNGAGKTTLFRILVGEDSLDDGKLVLSRQLRVGYLSQHDLWSPGETTEEFISRDSVLPIWELKALGTGLGLHEDLYYVPIQSLSGGYRMRAKLLQLLGRQPNLMLLDEPTNYLDLETLLVLEKFLQEYKGSFLLISHDREFLRHTTEYTLEVEGGEITKYNGNIDQYFEQKELLRSQLEARALSLEEKKKQILEFVNRFGAKASKARQAQSRLKTLNKMESVEVKPLPVGAKIKIPPPARNSKLVLQANGIDLGSETRTVLHNVNLQLVGSDHLAVVGLNGAGKSTLLKALAGRLQPQKGAVQYGYEVTIGYFAQHVAEELDPDETVIEALHRKAHPSILPQEILDLAGSLLFSGKDVRKEVRILSGGERSRVALGQVLLQRAGCLILDEPTNHLDFQTVEALTQSLKAFQGSLVVVSHDRSFIGRIGTKILEIQQGKAQTYPGTYDEYLWSLEQGAYAVLHPNASPASTKKSEGRKNQPEPKSSNQDSREKKKDLDRKIRDLENLLSSSQLRLQTLNQELSTSPNDYQKMMEISKVQKEIDSLEARWLEASSEKEKLNF